VLAPFRSTIWLVVPFQKSGLVLCALWAADAVHAWRLAPAAGTMSPVPPASSPLPPATPTTVTATHVAMRTDHHRLRRLSRLRHSRHETPADRCKTGDSSDGARQDVCQDVAATHCSHCVCSLVRIIFQST